MRNLKRALSLALATVMTLGLMVVGTGAVSYDDVTSEDNQEAIEVLQAVGIMTGVSETEFNPDGLVTRNEMAVIMSQLLNLDYDYYRGVNPFTDVPAWAAPYVAACAAEGVVAGIGDGLYGGNNNVTAAQAALMIMKALGYFQYQNDFGDDWQIATIRQASYISLFDGVDANAEQALTRNQIAQLVLNGLTSDMVYFTGDVGATVGDVVINYRPEYTSRTGSAIKYNALVGGRTDIAQQGQYYIQLGEELYDGDLEMSPDIDDFGRPSTTWTYENEDIGTYVNEDLLVAEYTESFEYGDLYNDVGSNAAKYYDLFTYVDGYVGSVDQDEITRNNDEEVPDSDLGALTQVFVDLDAEEITVTTINTYLAQAITDYNETTGKATLNVYTGRTTTGTTDSVSKRLSDEDFEIVKEMVEDDFYTVTMAKGVVKTVGVPEIIADVTASEYSSKPVNGQSHKNDTDGRLTKVIVDGATYKTAAQAWFDAEYLYDYAEKQLDGFTYDLLLDQYGNLLGIDNVTSDEDSFFVVGYEVGSSYLASTVDKALVIFPDGRMERVDAMEKKLTPAFTIPDGDGSYRVNAWYDYTINSDGVYVISGLSENQISDQYTVGNKIDRENTTFESKGDVNNTKGLDFIYGNADSVYIAVDADTDVSGDGSIVKVNGVTTGIKNTSIEAEAGLAYDDDVRDGWGACNVFALYNNSGYVTYAVVIGEDGSIADNLVYLTSGITSKYYDSTIKEYVYRYDALVNGEPVEIESLTAFEVDGTTDLVKDTLYEASYDADGFITDMEKPDTPYKTMDNTAAYKDNGYSVDSYPTTPATLTLSGATLYVTAADNTHYAILDEDCRFYVNGEDDTDGKYNEYANASAMLAALGTDRKIDEGGQLVVIADTNTGFATAIIILDTKYYAKGDGDLESNLEVWSSGSEVASMSGKISITGGTVSLTGGNYVVNAALSPEDTAASTNVQVTYEISKYNYITNKWEDAEIVTSAKTPNLLKNTSIDSVSAANFAVPAGVDCMVKVTISGSGFSYSYPAVVVTSA